MRLVATQKFDYNNRSLNVGDSFDAPELHANIFITNSKAKKLETRVMDASDNQQQKVEKPSEREEEKIKGTRNRRYMRRDMRSEK